MLSGPDNAHCTHRTLHIDRGARRRRTPGPTHRPAGLAAPPTKRCDDEGLWAPCTIRTWRSTPCRTHSTCTVGTSTVLLRGGGDVPPEFPTLARPSLRCSRAHRTAPVASVRTSRHRRSRPDRSAGVASSTWARPDHSAGVASVSIRASRHRCSLPSRPESDRSAAVTATRNPRRSHRITGCACAQTWASTTRRSPARHRQTPSSTAETSSHAPLDLWPPAPHARARVPWTGKQLPPECLPPALAPRPRPRLLASQTATL